MPVEEINLAAFSQLDPGESQTEQEAAVQFAASNLFDLLPAGSHFPIPPAGLAIPLTAVRSKLKEVSHVNVRGAKDFLHELFRKVNLEEVDACKQLRQRSVVVGEGAPAGNCPIVVPSLKELETILRQGFGCVIADSEGAIHYLQAFPPFTSRDFRSLGRQVATNQSPAGTPRSCDLCSGVFYSPKIGKCQLFSFNTDEILSREDGSGAEGTLPETILDALHTSMFSPMLEKRKPGIHRRTLLYLTAPAEWTSAADQHRQQPGAQTDTHCSSIYAPSMNSGERMKQKVGGGEGGAEANGEDEMKKMDLHPQKQIQKEEENREEQQKTLRAKSEEKIDRHQQSPQAALSPPRLVPSILSWVHTIHDELSKGKSLAAGSASLDFSSHHAVPPGSTASNSLRLGAKIVLSVADGLEQLTHSLGSPKNGHLPDRLSLAGFQTFDCFVANLIYDGIHLITDVDVEDQLQAMTLQLARAEQGPVAAHAKPSLEEGLRNFQEVLSYLGQKNHDKVTGKVQVFHSLLVTNHDDIGASSTPAGQEGCETAKMLLITLVPESIAGGYIVITFNLLPPSSSASGSVKSGTAEYLFIPSLNDLRLQEACRETFTSPKGQGSSPQNQNDMKETPVVHLLGFKPTAVTSPPIQVRIVPEALNPERTSTVSPKAVPSPAVGAAPDKSLAGSPKNTPSGGGLSATAASNGSGEEQLLTEIDSKLQQIRTEKLRKLAALQGELSKVEEVTATKKSELDAMNADLKVLNGCEEKDRALDQLERQGESRGLQDSVRQTQKKALADRLSDFKLRLQRKRVENEVTRNAVKADRERLMNDAKNASFSSPPRSSERGGSNSSQPRSGFQTSSSLPSSSPSSTSAEARKPSSATSSTTPAASAKSVPKTSSSTARPGTAPAASKPKTTAPLTDREYAMQLQRKQEEELRDYEYAKSLQVLQD